MEALGLQSRVRTSDREQNKKSDSRNIPFKKENEKEVDEEFKGQSFTMESAHKNRNPLQVL